MSFVDELLKNEKTGYVHNITGCGFRLFIQSLYTFPLGFEIDEFADDHDPFDLPDLQIGNFKPDLNGNLVFFAKYTPLIVDLYLVPNTQGERNCRVMFNSNYVAAQKGNTGDVITMVCKYADGTTKIALNGRINVGSPFQSIANNGRIKSQHFQFVFEKPAN